ncbi:hypothetical protein Ahy_A09g041548 [Arachis hypogaea]|uniref:Uncharacterized protein n=1 Tax=Arachis hypogaea TaxID=3818 RepID=A0A445BD77_ARAHY|nr:hypothetical protein Ahy_A09g041548 [Arachis hypogaea]
MGTATGIGNLLVLAILIATAMADSAAVHIVYTEQPHGEEPEAFHIRTLSAVLGRVDSNTVGEQRNVC